MRCATGVSGPTLALLHLLAGKATPLHLASTYAHSPLCSGVLLCGYCLVVLLFTLLFSFFLVVAFRCCFTLLLYVVPFLFLLLLLLLLPLLSLPLLLLLLLVVFMRGFGRRAAACE